MILNSTAMSCNFIEAPEELKSPQLVVNTINFSDQDLEDYVNISEEIERSSRERRSQRKCSRSRSKTMVATMTREEIFESTNIDDDQFLEAMEHETTYDTEKNHAALVSSIENLMKYFDEEVDVKDESLLNGSPVKKLTKGKVASAVASLRNKCGLTVSPLSKRKTRQSEVKSNIQELKKKYDTSIETDETSMSPTDIKSKSSKSTRKTKVKQMALLFNNKINSIIKSTSMESQTSAPVSPGLESISSPTFTSTLKSKSPKVKTKFPFFVAKLPSPKPSPFFKRKQQQLSKSASNNSLTNTPLTKRNQQLQNQPSTTCLVAENVFSQLSVKDKALLYNKFIADISEQNPKFHKHAELLKSNVKKEIQKGEVVVEKQNSVKHLRDCLEAKLAPNKNFSKTLQRFKRSSSKLSLDATHKSKEYEDIFQNEISSSRCEDDSQELLHVSTLTVVLKDSPESKKWLPETKSKSQCKKQDVTFLEDASGVETSHKRTQSMLRASFCVEPLAPPKKIRRTLHESLAPGMFFQNQHLEKLFYHWLKEKNGVAFDITSVKNKNGIIDIVPKNTCDNILPPEEVEKILEAAIKNLESRAQQEKLAEAANNNDAMNVIKNTLENEKSLDKSIIEVELPVEVEVAETKKNEIEDSDLGLASLAKTTSEDSLTEFKSHQVSNLSRKRKLRRPLTLRKENSSHNLFSTDSDSDAKTRSIQLQCCTLPKSKKCSNYVKKLILKTLNSSGTVEQPRHLNPELDKLDLDRSLIKQVNSPSKVKTAYTLTVMSSPSPHSESDFCDSDLPKTPMKETSRSWPSLLEASWESDTNLLKHKYDSKEFKDLANIQIEQDQHKFTMDSFIDQGFETGSNETESPLRLPRKADHVIQKSLTKLENPANLPIPCENNSQPESPKYHSVTPIPSNSTFRMTIAKENMEDLQERNNATTSLNACTSCLSQDSLNYPLDVTQKGDSSQFWITSGDFTAAITIHHYESERLLQLSNIYAQKSLDTKEIHFGIDDQTFCLNSSAISDEIIKKVPQENDCSQYWFSTGKVLMPFRGKQMNTKKIHCFFKYIREFVEETGSLRFGIDGYEFSNSYQQTQNSTSPCSVSTWAQTASRLKTSDLDQSDIENLNVSALSQHLDSASFNSDVFTDSQQSSLSLSEDSGHPDLSKDQNDKQALKSEYSVPPMRNEKDKLKLVNEERILNCTNNIGPQEFTDTDEADEYTRKLQILITALQNVGRSNNFNTCSAEQLESFMFFLNRYADLCSANYGVHMQRN